MSSREQIDTFELRPGLVCTIEHHTEDEAIVETIGRVVFRHTDPEYFQCIHYVVLDTPEGHSVTIRGIDIIRVFSVDDETIQIPEKPQQGLWRVHKVQ